VRDIGRALGVPAHMKALAREAVGPFRRPRPSRSTDLAGGRARLLPMEAVLERTMPAVAVSDAEAARLDRGQPVPTTGALQPRRRSRCCTGAGCGRSRAPTPGFSARSRFFIPARKAKNPIP
jgi:tRNA U55 pseudouridine synthase TruB